MQVKSATKYDLRDLYQEIDLFDRKIAYNQSYERFDSEPEREAALRKLESKRLGLVKKAMTAVSDGIECDPKYLPRSLSKPAGAKAGA